MQTVDLQQLSAEMIAPPSFAEGGQGTATITTQTSKPVPKPKAKKKSASSPMGADPSRSADAQNTASNLPNGAESGMIDTSKTMTHALVGALIGGIMGYAWKKDKAWALGGAAIGFMGTNLYETKSIFGNTGA